jgi:hypothetical protein
MAVALSVDVCTTIVVEESIVTVDVSDGVIWTVLISLACAASCGNINSHRVKSAVINADLSNNFLINPSPLIRTMSNRVIIPFY